ncbi:MAG: hypothetical protein K9J74_06855 [Sulfuritalea sp.]|nr:hypothetical protein [Sulfuritalea sp.]
MNTALIFIRTDKGEREAGSESTGLSSGLLELLRAIDGVSTVADLASRFDNFSSVELNEALNALVDADLISESEISSGDESQRQAQALRAKLMARRMKTGSSNSELGTPDADVEDPAQRAAEVEAQQEAEAQAQRKAEEEARLEAEAKARKDAEENARRLAEDQERRVAEEQAHRAAEEQSRLDAAEQERREAEERTRQEAAAQDRLALEEAARLEADKKAQQAEKEARARKRAKEQASLATKIAVLEWIRRWGKGLALGLVMMLLIGLGGIHLMSFDGQIPSFEKALTKQFQQPVKIKSLHIALIPRPLLRFEEISVGSGGQIRISRAEAMGNLGSLFSERKEFKSIELDQMAVTEEGLAWILFGKPVAQGIGLGQIGVTTVKLESTHFSVPAFGAKIGMDEGGTWTGIEIEYHDKNLKLKLVPQAEAVQFDIDATSFRIPFGSNLTLEDLIAKGSADRNGLSLSEFRGFIVGGFLSGDARLDWRANWSLAGALKAKQIDAGLLAPGVLSNARLTGAASYSMQAAESAKLFTSPRLEGNLGIERGTLLGVDIPRMLQGRGLRGDTRFVDLTAGFVHEQGVTKIRQLHMSDGALSASGTVDIDAEMQVSGKLAVDLKLDSDRRRATLAISGTSKKLKWDRQ